MSGLKIEYRIVCARHGEVPSHRPHAYPKKSLAKAEEARIENEAHTAKLNKSSPGGYGGYFAGESPWRIETRKIGDWVVYEGCAFWCRSRRTVMNDWLDIEHLEEKIKILERTLRRLKVGSDAKDEWTVIAATCRGLEREALKVLEEIANE